MYHDFFVPSILADTENGSTFCYLYVRTYVVVWKLYFQFNIHKKWWYMHKKPFYYAMKWKSRSNLLGFIQKKNYDWLEEIAFALYRMTKLRQNSLRQRWDLTSDGCQSPSRCRNKIHWQYNLEILYKYEIKQLYLEMTGLFICLKLFACSLFRICLFLIFG